MPVTAGARQSGGGETQAGGTEEEVCGEGETDPRSAREPERTANPAAAAGQRLINIHFQKCSMDDNKATAFTTIAAFESSLISTVASPAP